MQLRPPTSTLFPYRRSSDLEVKFAADRMLGKLVKWLRVVGEDVIYGPHLSGYGLIRAARRENRVDRKSTRLNSSHRCISYAVFCLKKKKYNDRSVLSVSAAV